jgi:hypothetical protein
MIESTNWQSRNLELWTISRQKQAQLRPVIYQPPVSRLLITSNTKRLPVRFQNYPRLVRAFSPSAHKMTFLLKHHPQPAPLAPQ